MAVPTPAALLLHRILAGLWLLGALLQAAPAAAGSSWRRAAEAFLVEAGVVGREPLATGVTRSERLTLRLGERSERAVWKTIDDYRRSARLADSPIPELGFRDSWKNEVAAYRLDRLLGLDLVPPTIERRIDGRQGSLQLWLDDVVTETERRAGRHEPPDLLAWSVQMGRVRLLHQLVHDTDHENTGNILVDEDFRVWVIDSSRAFRTRKELLPDAPLHRYERAVWERLRALDAEELNVAVGRWLSGAQRGALLARRDLLVAEAEARIAELGEAAVIAD